MKKSPFAGLIAITLVLGTLSSHIPLARANTASDQKQVAEQMQRMQAEMERAKAAAARALAEAQAQAQRQQQEAARAQAAAKAAAQAQAQAAAQAQRQQQEAARAQAAAKAQAAAQAQAQAAAQAQRQQQEAARAQAAAQAQAEAAAQAQRQQQEAARAQAAAKAQAAVQAEAAAQAQRQQQEAARAQAAAKAQAEAQAQAQQQEAARAKAEAQAESQRQKAASAQTAPNSQVSEAPNVIRVPTSVALPTPPPAPPLPPIEANAAPVPAVADAPTDEPKPVAPALRIARATPEVDTGLTTGASDSSDGRSYLTGPSSGMAHLNVATIPPAITAPPTPAASSREEGEATNPSVVVTPIAPPSTPPAQAVVAPLASEQDILANGVPASDLAKLKNLGFTTTPGADGAPARLAPPAGITNAQARALLDKQMPLTPFYPNHAFRIFAGSIGNDERAEAACQNSQDRKCNPLAWINWSPQLSSCAVGVPVGIIDTSFDTSHPAFSNLDFETKAFLGGQSPTAYDWHGTAVLSQLAGGRESGTAGLLPKAKYLLAAAFISDEHGNASADTARIMAALAWLDQKGARLINMSFSGPKDELIEKMIQRMSAKGVVFVAAAGNNGPTAPASYPAAYPEVISVTAINSRGENYRHANRGTYIDFSAPGVDIPTALPNAHFGRKTGTSFAAPFVTAIMALREPTQKGGMSKNQLLATIAADDLGPAGNDPIYGRGLVKAPASCGGAIASNAQPSAPAARKLPPPAIVFPVVEGPVGLSALRKEARASSE